MDIQGQVWPIKPGKCAWCGKSLAGKRPHSQTCSVRCRVAYARRLQLKEEMRKIVCKGPWPVDGCGCFACDSFRFVAKQDAKRKKATKVK